MSAALIVFIALFAGVTVLGFYASRWRAGDMSQLSEWGLGGRRFGSLITWFMLGGDLYTAYTFVAVPALIFAGGAVGFFAVPYAAIAYIVMYFAFPRLWSVAQAKGYVTGADFVRGRFGSRTLALAIALTGIVATMPYIALQLVGMEVVLAGLGLHGEWPVIVAFVVLAAYTYASGIRAPAMIAVVKDILIYATVIAAVIVIPAELGGYAKMFAAVPARNLLLSANPFSNPGMFSYATLALGSALALFLYPHAATGVMAASNRTVIKRNAVALPAYSLVLGLIALLGFMALAAGVKSMPQYAGAFNTFGNNFAVPALFLQMFPGWFVGVAFAAIAIGALVPAAIMSIACANLFTRNIYREFFRPDCSPAHESQVAKIASLFVKLGALIFILEGQSKTAIELQLLGGIWIIQTLPAILIGLYSRWLNGYALLIGWACGMSAGTWMAAQSGFKASVYVLHTGSVALPCYAALWSVILNIAISALLSLVFNAMMSPRADATAAEDYA